MKHKFKFLINQSIIIITSFLQKGVKLIAGRLLPLVVLLTSLTSALVHADQGANDINVASKVLPIGSQYQNSIPLLNNRFRIDSDVQEVTLVFFRELGSAPIVLVRPDGSKLYLENDESDDNFDWFETDSYDMIALQDPMPGPWQAVGNILPQSRVMVIAGIRLNAEPIPSPVFSGESIKQTAHLENAGSKVNFSSFRDIVSLSIEFVSTNEPTHSNFGIGSRAVARFEDNGLGFDEFDGDGVFTGLFDLNITEGEWRPIFTLRTPLFSREQMNENIVLLPNPVKVSHQLMVNELGDHQVTVDVDTQHVALDSLLLDGSVRHPNGETLRFAVSEKSAEPKIIPVMHTEFGIYKVNMTVYAVSTQGRDLVLSIPEYSFVTKAPEIEPLVVDEIETESKAPIVTIDFPKAQVKPENSFVLWAIIINVCLLIVGGLVISLVIYKRNHPQANILLVLKQKCSRIKKTPNESTT